MLFTLKNFYWIIFLVIFFPSHLFLLDSHHSDVESLMIFCFAFLFFICVFLLYSWEIYPILSSLNYSFSQLFVESLLWTKQYLRCWKYLWGKKIPVIIDHTVFGPYYWVVGFCYKILSFQELFVIWVFYLQMFSSAFWLFKYEHLNRFFWSFFLPTQFPFPQSSICFGLHLSY